MTAALLKRLDEQTGKFQLHIPKEALSLADVQISTAGVALEKASHARCLTIWRRTVFLCAEESSCSCR